MSVRMCNLKGQGIILTHTGQFDSLFYFCLLSLSLLKLYLTSFVSHFLQSSIGQKRKKWSTVTCLKNVRALTHTLHCYMFVLSTWFFLSVCLSVSIMMVRVYNVCVLAFGAVSGESHFNSVPSDQAGIP